MGSLPSYQQQPTTDDSVEQRFTRTISAVEVLRHNLDAATNGLFNQAFASLETLPLTTSEFSLAACRIGNARNYSANQESTAAAYELTLLLNGLKTIRRRFVTKNRV